MTKSEVRNTAWNASSLLGYLVPKTSYQLASSTYSTNEEYRSNQLAFCTPREPTIARELQQSCGQLVVTTPIASIVK
jgi:hypothetical protein